MKAKLFIVGESVPNKAAWQQGELGAKLEPLDSRHGVFPNHVMTPLLATMIALPAQRRSEFCDCLSRQLLVPRSVFRRNVFDIDVNPRKDSTVRFSPELHQWFPTKEEDPALHLVIGFWPMLGLLFRLLVAKPEESVSSTVWKKFMEAARKSMERQDLTMSGNLGAWLRLCIADEPTKITEYMDRLAAYATKEGVCVEWNKERRDQSVRVLRTLIPIPHNEIYQNPDIGKHQNHYMLMLAERALPTPCAKEYWRFIGEIISARLQGCFLDSNFFDELTVREGPQK